LSKVGNSGVPARVSVLHAETRSSGVWTESSHGYHTAKVAGDFLFHGVTKPLTVDATVKYLPGKLKARGGVEKDGDIVQVYSKFSVNRLDFDVAPDLSTDLIGNKIDIDLAVTGIAVR
jgi:polyisoprenoid-binding protein YceI